MGVTKIEWVRGLNGTKGKTWNVITGCTEKSPGCANCYAKLMAKRLKAMGVEKYKNGFDVTLHPYVLDEPLSWRKPCVIFPCSMSDLFHEDVPFEFIDRVFSVMALCKRHTFLILTKRAERMSEYFTSVANLQEESSRDMAIFDAWRAVYGSELNERYWPLPNVWFGVTVENQGAADKRYMSVKALYDAGVRNLFVSYEPALSDVDWSPWMKIIRWFICGGESGPKARPMHPNYPRSLRDQCVAAGVPYFFKQWGSAPFGRGNQLADTFEAGFSGSEKKGGRMLDGRTWDQFPGVKK